MNKTLKIAKREFLATVKKKGFIAFVIIFPLAIIAFLYIVFSLSSNTFGEMPNEIGFIDHANLLEESTGFLRFEDFETAKNSLINNEIVAFFELPEKYLYGENITIYMKDSLFATTPINQINNFILQSLVNSSSLENNLKQRIYNPSQGYEEKKLDSNGNIKEKEETSNINFFIPYIFSLLLVISLLTSSGYLLQGILEEKEHKTIEILLSSVTSESLLKGKILGLGGAGILQVLIWVFVAAIFIGFNPVLFEGVNLMFILFLVIPYFIFGFLLFTSSYACIAAISKDMKYAQQNTTIITMLAILPIAFLSVFLAAPNSIFAKILTYIPFSAPSTAIIRMSLTTIHPVEIILSFAILIASVVIIMKMAGKLFRANTLMSGKNFNLKEIIKVIKQK